MSRLRTEREREMRACLRARYALEMQRRRSTMYVECWWGVEKI